MTIMTSASSKRKSGLPILKFSNNHRISIMNIKGSNKNKGRHYSAICTPVKEKIGNTSNCNAAAAAVGSSSAVGVVTPATTKTTAPTQTPRTNDGDSNSISDFNSRHRSFSSLPPPPSLSKQSTFKEEAVKVCVRIRPLFVNENDSSSSSDNEPPRAWTTSPSDVNTIIHNIPSSSVSSSSSSCHPKSYKFDQVYGESSTTLEIYNDIASDIIHSVCNQGRNGTIFTYGQTATGKTFTMHGILGEVGKDLFRYCNEKKDHDDFAVRRVTFDNDVITNNTKKPMSTTTMTTTIHVSCMELYNEELYDLLSPNTNKTATSSSSSLAINEDRQGNVLIPNLNEWKVTNINELLNIIDIVEEKRTIGSTAMNERSSRSHTIFRIRYMVRKEEEQESGGVGGDEKENGLGVGKKVVTTTTSVLNLVDLAGSESVRLTGAKGVRQKEGGKINQSLLTLSRVLEKLGNKQEYSSGSSGGVGHVNYRDSKLTRILKPSLSGNARMGAICCISPAMQFSEETKSTLDFATRTMLVTTNAKSNEVVEEHRDILVAEFEKEMERIKLETMQVEESRVQMEQSLHSAQDEIKSLKLQLQSVKKGAEEEKEKIVWELMDLTRQNKDLKENLQTTLRATELNKQAMELVRSQAKDLEKENQEFEAQVKELTRRNKELEQGNMDLKQNMQNTYSATELNKRAMEVIRKRMKDLEKENEAYRIQVEDLTLCNEDLTQRNTDLKQDMQNTVSATTLHKQAMESIRIQVKELERKNGAYVVQVGTLNRRNKELERNAEISSEAIDEMQDTIDELNLQNQHFGRLLEMYTNKSKKSRHDESEQRRSFQGKVETLMGRMREEVEELSLSPKVSFD